MLQRLSPNAHLVARAAVIAVALCCPRIAGAQDAASPPPVPEVSQPEPPAALLAAARDVVVASGMARSFTPMVPQLVDQIVPLMTRTRPELVKDLSAVVDQLRPEFIKDGDQMIDIAAHIYARQMSEQELKDAAAFFYSAVGKRYVAVQPQMLDDLVVSMQSWTQSMSNTIMVRVRQEMIKKGHNDF